MPWPVRHLPVIQNWDCHACGQCCKEYAVTITPEEKLRIEQQGWANLPEFRDVPLVVREGWFRKTYHLNHRSDGSCVFLDEAGLCRIHGKFGGTQKPLACQVYPYVLIPAGDHWRVGVRFACPSASSNKGRPVTAQHGDIDAYAQQLDVREGVRDRSDKPPGLVGRQKVSWEQIGRIVTQLVAIIKEDERSIEYRWRHILAVTKLCRASDLQNLPGGKLREFLALVSPACTVNLNSHNHEVALPSRMGQILFRLAAAVYCRRDTGPRRGSAQRNRLSLLRAAFRFARGQGQVPRLHGLLPEISFEEMEKSTGTIPNESELLLERYYRVKLESYQFFGPTHFHDKFWNGVEALALTLPVILWLSRAFADRDRAAAIETALQIVDDNFGYNALLGTRRQRWITRTLASRDDLPRLIAWYSR